MSYTTFITPEQAREHLHQPGYLFIDCRFSLADKQWGEKEYVKSHIPGALYADLEHELSGTIIPGTTGRHPLPSKEALAELFSSWGIGPETQVIAYDETAGFMAAARLWWLLQWAGHQKAAVLMGGRQTWATLGFPLDDEPVGMPAPTTFKAQFRDDLLASADDVSAVIDNQHACLIDSRTADRYAGQNETIDPVAGHVPSALSRPFNANIDSTGKADPEKVRATFAADFQKDQVIFYCGSGVTAAFNILLAVYAGYPFPRLYAGSWSEWIADPARPLATGPDPR